MRRKNLCLCTILVGSMLLAACGNSSTADTQNNSVVAENNTESENSDVANQGETNQIIKEVFDTVTGMIQNIDNSTVTLAVMRMPGGQMPGGEVPEMPSGELQMPGGEVPEMPSGELQMPGGEIPEMPNGQQPQMPGGNMMGGESEVVNVTITENTAILDAFGKAITVEELGNSSMVTVQMDVEGNAISITLSDMNFAMGGPGGMGPGGMSQGAPTSYDALMSYTEDTAVAGETISSTGVDENAVLVSDGATVMLDQMTLNRTSADSTGGDSSSFYGIGAAVLATDGTVEVKNSVIETDAAGGAGVFAYGTGVAYVSDSVITTTQNTSGGIHVAGGGTLHASNLTIETNGESAAAIRSDRGGGTMIVDGGTYTSNGPGSPAVYCTADISVDNATLTATGSEAVCIEGLNSLVLTNCDLTGNMPDLSQNDCTWTVILYQSMSGDSEIGNSTFTMQGGSLTSQNGGLFYTTNTESTFYLSDVEITCADDCEFFLKCTGNQNQRGWGQSGANGADCTFTADAQEMRGNILWDSISTLDFAMQKGSTLTGAFLQDESAAGNGGNGYANLTIDETSTWIVTENSTLSTLNCKGTIADANQNPVTIQGIDGTVYVEGTSPYTITVTAYNK